MNGIRVSAFGDDSQLRYESLPEPQPGPGQVRVRVAAAGLNYVEIYQRKGQYPRLPTTPYTPGAEFSGTIDAVGAGVTDYRPGDRVATASGGGAYAELAIAPADKLVRVPDDLDLELAAAIPLQGFTAHYLVNSTYVLKAGEIALIHAAAGGVGQLLVQLAKARGASVIATVSTEEKAALAREAGADHVILYSQVDFEAETMRITGGKGVDVVYDSVGRTTFLKGFNVLRNRGMMVLYGAASGNVEPIDPMILFAKSLFLTRPSLGGYLQTREEVEWRGRDLFGAVQAGTLRVRIDQRLPLAEAARAQRYMEGRETKGKVLLIP